MGIKNLQFSTNVSPNLENDIQIQPWCVST